LLISLNNQTFRDFDALVVVNRDIKYFDKLVNKIKDWKELAFEVNVVFTPENLGIAHDRNIALKTANTPLVAFTDDDALPHKDWLRTINASFETYDHAGAITGPILAYWNPDIAASASWFPKELYWIIGCSYKESQSCVEVRNGFASNLSLNREISLRCGGFNEAFGYHPKYPMAGEEPELCMKMKKVGKLTLWNPKAVVYHRVNANRLSLNEIVTRSYIEGRSKAYLERDFGRGTLATEREQVAAVAKALLKAGPVKSKIYLAASTYAVAVGYILSRTKIIAKQAAKNAPFNSAKTNRTSTNEPRKQ
jgi:GT2 family glycosyltransferase